MTRSTKWLCGSQAVLWCIVLGFVWIWPSTISGFLHRKNLVVAWQAPEMKWFITSLSTAILIAICCVFFTTKTPHKLKLVTDSAVPDDMTRKQAEVLANHPEWPSSFQ